MNVGVTLIAATDMERSKRFYEDVLGLKVTADFGTNVILGDNSLSLQTIDTWVNFIGGRDVSLGGNAFERFILRKTIQTAWWRNYPASQA